MPGREHPDPLRLALELALAFADARGEAMVGIHLSAALDQVDPERALLVVDGLGELRRPIDLHADRIADPR